MTQLTPIGVVRRASRPWPLLFWVNVGLWTAFHAIPIVFGIAVGPVQEEVAGAVIELPASDDEVGGESTTKAVAEAT